MKQLQFTLPKSLIAQKPAEPRDSSRLLVYSRETGKITDAVFRDIGSYLPAETALVLNNAKVDKARLLFGKIEVFVLEVHNNTTVTALVRPGKKFRLNDTVQLANGIDAHVIDITKDGHRRIELSKPLDDKAFDEFRLTPLPPYIAQDESLSERYQTVYAKEQGSKAAPTAGLHFTDELLAQLKKKHSIHEITLHVSLGTFAPISEENFATKTLHTELYEVSEAAAEQISNEPSVTAVGTTSCRLLESTSDEHGKIHAGTGETNIFITPGYTFKKVDNLITNFHLPETSLLQLVGALTGMEELERIYQRAIKEKYRFYSFGDAMLIV